MDGAGFLVLELYICSSNSVPERCTVVPAPLYFALVSLPALFFAPHIHTSFILKNADDGGRVSMQALSSRCILEV